MAATPARTARAVFLIFRNLSALSGNDAPDPRKPSPKTFFHNFLKNIPRDLIMNFLLCTLKAEGRMEI